MQNDDPWAVDPPGSALGAASTQADPMAGPQPPVSLEQALLALDHRSAPVFAVLDGAQFDNLPRELLFGDFVSRPLYLDRGDNNPEQIITAPHMVWLDERAEKVTGRTPGETIPALFALIANRPAAVFWQCPAGAEVLYKHLRGINMAMFPKAALADFSEQELPDIEAQPEAQIPDTHTLVLFRHADANVIAQTLPALEQVQLSRLFGPATAIFAAPDREWSWSDSWISAPKPDGLPPAPGGALRLSEAEIDRISQATERAEQQRIAYYLRSAAPQYTERLSAEQLDQVVADAMREGRDIGLSSEKGLGLFAMLSLLSGGELIKDPHLRAAIANDPRPGDDVVVSIFEDISNMSRAEIRGFTS